MNDLIIWASHIVKNFGVAAYVLLAVIAMFEALPVVGLLVPGVIITITVGIFSAWGIFNLPSVIVVAALGALAGDIGSFIIGKRFKSSFKKEHRFLKPEYLERAEFFNKRWGSAGILFGRFIGPLRSMINVVAGMTKVSWLRFSILSTIGSFLFVSFYIIIGYFAGSAWQTIESWSSRVGLVLLALVIILAIVWWFKGFIVRQGKQLRLIIASLIKDAFDAVLASQIWKGFRARFSSVAHSFERRFNPRSFKGLPLLSLIVVVVLCLGAAWLIGCAALDSLGFWSNFDERIRASVSLFSDSRLAIAAFLITVFGSTNFIITAGSAMTFWLLLENRRSHIIGLWTAVIGSLVSSGVIKFVFAKPRPDPTYYFENFYAYPSIHSTLALAFFIYFVYYAIHAYPRWSRNVSIILTASVAVLLIGLSRVYLGVHYPTDVIGGFLVGAAWLIIGIIMQRFFEHKETPRRLKKIFQIWLLSGITLLLFAFYVSQTFDRGTLKNFYYALPTITEQRQAIDMTNPKQWPPITENLRGARLRPINALILSDEQKIRSALTSAGWLERSQPTVSGLVQSGLNSLVKKDNLNSPIRPRFWRNHPNDLAFIKPNSLKDRGDGYVLRLWKTQLVDMNTVYIVELSVNKDFSFWKNTQDEDLSVATERLLLSDALNQSSFKKINTFSFDLDIDGDKDKDTQTITIYVLSL